MLLRIGIIGYGNLGKSAAQAVLQTSDCELSVILTERNPSEIPNPPAGIRIFPFCDLEHFLNETDVFLLCKGSASYTTGLATKLADQACLVDSFYAPAPSHRCALHEAASSAHTTALIAAGWDPGYFSLLRLYAEAFLPQGITHTFLGTGINRKHTHTLYRLLQTRNTVAFTVPSPRAIRLAQKGSLVPLSAKQTHKQVCYLTEKQKQETENRIATLQDSFCGHEISCRYVGTETLRRLKRDRSHRGRIIRNGICGTTSSSIATNVRLGSDLDFTASILVACARAVYRLYQDGIFGALTLLDVPPRYLLPENADIDGIL